MSGLRFNGGEIVRLRISREGVAAGCCGIVRGVYDEKPVVYEATFVDEHGELADATFGEDDVDQLSDISVELVPSRLEEIRLALTTLKRPG